MTVATSRTLLCLYQQTTFQITCSLNNTNVPNFVYEWQFDGATITDSDGKYFIVTQKNKSISVLTVLESGVQ